MITPSFLLIMSFYIVLIGISMGIGAFIGGSIRQVFEMAGFVIGAGVGIWISYLLWINYGSPMVQRAQLSSRLGLSGMYSY